MNHILQPAIRPLRLIFWGALLCILDFHFSSTTNGSGFKLDILSDFVGIVMISIGVFRLKEVPCNDTYKLLMHCIIVVCLLQGLNAVDGHFIYKRPSLLLFLEQLLGLITMIAITAFSLCMYWLAKFHELPRSRQSWFKTTVLFFCLYLIPLGLFYLASCFASISSNSFHLNLGIFGILLIPVFLIPPIHLFISTSRMQKEISSLES